MAIVQRAQKDFSGGEVSKRVAMRDDTEMYFKSVLRMENFFPTLQGTAIRTPGSTFSYDLGTNAARIIPYLTPFNQHSIVEIAKVGANPATIVIRTGLTEDARNVGAQRQIVPNNFLNAGFEDWDIERVQYTGGANDVLGFEVLASAIRGTCRLWVYPTKDDITCKMSGQATLTDDTASLLIAPDIQYAANFTSVTSGYTCFIKVGTTLGASDIFNYEFKFGVGYRYTQTTPVVVALTAGQVVHYSLEWTAISTPDEPHSTPSFIVRKFSIFSDIPASSVDDTVIGVPPYTGAELKDLQFVQSPYIDLEPGNAQPALGKPLIIVHPNHPPYYLYFNGDEVPTPSYVFNPVSFVNEPVVWAADGYPSACTSMNGRLILAGSISDEGTSAVTGTPTETVWGTEVGKWTRFTPEAVEGDTGVNPDDSIEFTTIYRSPIQWVFGQQILMVGAEAMEYVSSTDGIFSPGDLGVQMTSTHGSSNVQPAGMGDRVLFAADNGRKVRAMFRQDRQQSEEGWVARDMTLAHPDLFQSGIVRMVRMRTPHQMIVVVMGNGQMAALHQDTYAGIFGWSRINLNANVLDACVVQQDDGTDALFIYVRRVIDGVNQYYVESFNAWEEGSRDRLFQQSALVVQPTAGSNILPGLSHLIGERVQVVADGNFIGSYLVQPDGTVILVDEIGQPLLVNVASVGLAMPCSLITLPLATNDPASKKRYANIYVRVLQGSRPIINGERTSDRDPETLQDESQPMDNYYDNKVGNMGTDATQEIAVSETLPVNTEIVAIFGTVAETNL